MSFSYTAWNKPADDVLVSIDDSQIPENLRPLVRDAVSAAAIGTHPKVPLNVNVNGHLWNGEPDNYNVSEAHVTVRLA